MYQGAAVAAFDSPPQPKMVHLPPLAEETRMQVELIDGIRTRTLRLYELLHGDFPPIPPLSDSAPTPNGYLPLIHHLQETGRELLHQIDSVVARLCEAAGDEAPKASAAGR